MVNARRRSCFSMVSLLGSLLLIGSALLLAQKTSTTPTGDKVRTTERYTGEHKTPINKPTSVLKIVKVKGVLDKIDLKKRTVTIIPQKQKDGLELTFPQPSGREQIKASKKAAKLLGRKKLTLEELKTGSKVQLQYYPLLGQVMELIIDRTS